MALPVKQPLFIPLGLGLQTDVDDKLLPVGKNLDLVNCQVQRQQEVVKRFGMAQLPAPGNVQGALGTHQGALVNMGTPLETLAGPNATRWTAADGDFRPGITAGLVKVDGNAGQPDLAYGGGFYWKIYRNVVFNTGALIACTLAKCVAIDAVTGHVAWSGSMVPTGSGTSLANWHVVYCNGKVVFTTIDNANTLNAMVVDPVTLTPSSVFSQTISDGGFADVIAQATVVTVGFVNASGNMAACDFDPISHAFTPWAAEDATAAPIPLDASFNWMHDYGGAGVLAAITSSASQGTKVQWHFPLTGSARAAATTYVVNAGVPADVCAGHTISSDATGEFVVAYGTAPGGGPQDIVFITRRQGGTIIFDGQAANVALVSKTWFYGGDSFAAVVHRSPTDGTAFVIRLGARGTNSYRPAPLAKIAVRACTSDDLGGLFSMGSVANPAPGVFCFPLMYTVRYEATVAAEQFGAEIAVVSHPGTLGVSSNVGAAGQQTTGIPREAIGSTFLPGAAMAQFDGHRFAEAGFAWSPDPGTTPTSTAAPGGLTPASTYYYVAVFARMDSQGRLWRSAPSVPFSGATAAGQGTLTFNLKSLGLTGRPNPPPFGDGVYDLIEVYRGIAGDDVTFMRAGAVPNDLTSGTLVAFTDKMSDADLSGQEFLYSNGNILENATPPGLFSTVEAQNRTWGISADDPQAIWPSKEHALGTGIEFAEELAIDVRNSHGPARAMAQVDDKPLVFKDDAVYVIGGSGPDNTGNGGSWAPQIVCAGIGCNNPRAICETKDGVIFRSTGQRAGFFMLDRGLSVTYIGAPVQRYDGESITGSLFSSLLLQARFMTVSGRTLVYDLVTGIWTTFTGQPCATAVSWGGQPAYVSTATAHVLAEDLSGQLLTDDGSAYEMIVGGPWVQANQVRGYQKFYRQQLVGEVAQGTVQIGMKMYADFGTVPLVSMVGAAPVGVIDKELKYPTKLSAVKTVISDNGSTTGVLKVSGITLILGVKAGLRKVDPANRFTG